MCFCNEPFLHCEQAGEFIAQVGAGSGKHNNFGTCPQTLVQLTLPFPLVFQLTASLPSLSVLDQGLLISGGAVYIPQTTCLSHVLLQRL